MNNKHKHYDKIVAKASNVGLVQFIKINGKWENAGLSDKFISFSEGYDYFLCLPQHKDAVLNCLNGGESQVASISSGWLPANCGDPVEWGGEWWYMNPNGESRIKPKKEKRWIATLNGWNASQKVFASKQEAVDLLGANSYEFHEIEVEV